MNYCWDYVSPDALTFNFSDPIDHNTISQWKWLNVKLKLVSPYAVLFRSKKCCTYLNEVRFDVTFLTFFFFRTVFLLSLTDYQTSSENTLSESKPTFSPKNVLLLQLVFDHIVEFLRKISISIIVVETSLRLSVLECD